MKRLVLAFVFLLIICGVSSSLAESMTARITVTGNEDPEQDLKQLRKLAKVFDFEIVGEFNFSGDYLKNKNAPRTQTISVPYGKSSLAITLEEAFILLKNNSGLLTSDLHITCLNSIYDWDGVDLKYDFNYHPAILIDYKKRTIKLRLTRIATNVLLSDYSIFRTTEVSSNKNNRIIKPGQEYDNYFSLGTVVRGYGLGNKNYNALGALNVGYNFSGNWGVKLTGFWKNKNNNLIQELQTQQGVIFSTELAQDDALVSVGAGAGLFTVENKPAEIYESGVFIPIIINGAWRPRKELRFDGGVSYNISTDRQDPCPASIATADLRVCPIPFDIFGNGQRNNYGLGGKMNIFLSNELAIENIAIYTWFGTGLASLKFPTKEFAIGWNRYAETRKSSVFVNISFTLGFK